MVKIALALASAMALPFVLMGCASSAGTQADKGDKHILVFDASEQTAKLFVLRATGSVVELPFSSDKWEEFGECDPNNGGRRIACPGREQRECVENGYEDAICVCVCQNDECTTYGKCVRGDEGSQLADDMVILIVP